MNQKRKCSKCGSATLALRKTTIRSSGVSRSFVCAQCRHAVVAGTWSNVAFSAATALVVMPAILAFHPRYTLQTVPPLFFGGMALFLALAGFEAFRLRQFEQRHPLV
jgi:hypothetical protein